LFPSGPEAFFYVPGTGVKKFEELIIVFQTGSLSILVVSIVKA